MKHLVGHYYRFKLLIVSMPAAPSSRYFCDLEGLQGHRQKNKKVFLDLGFGLSAGIRSILLSQSTFNDRPLVKKSDSIIYLV